MSRADPPLRAADLTKQYGPFTAVDGVTVRIEAGERVALLGPNGAGKSTFLRLVAGLTKPTSGNLTVHGREYGPGTRSLRRTVGFVAHETMLYENLTARENLAFHARLRGLPASRADEVLERVGLDHRATGFPDEFSHGMRKRLSLARAALDRPPIFLLDEPFAGLDQASIRTLLELLEDRTVVFATHDFERALDTCDRLLVLARGRVAADLDTATLPDVDALRDRYWSVIA
jgi:heme exporter protein A